MYSTFRCGYSGGIGGNEFADDAPASNERVAAIAVQHIGRIAALQVTYEGRSGVLHEMPRHGSVRGTSERIALDTDEYITAVTGKYTDRVNSIQIITNKQQLPPIGSLTGATYLYQAPDGEEIVGFCGRVGTEIDAIGVILRKRKASPIKIGRSVATKNTARRTKKTA